MSHRRPFALPVCALTAALSAQSFQYPDFANVAGVNLLGSAVQSGTAVRLTAVAVQQTGVFWHRTAMPTLAGFDTTFTFRITPPPTGVKAEGMAFLLQNDPAGIQAVGGSVWGMGYGVGANNNPGLRNCIAVEIDTYRDNFLGDTSANEVTIHTNGPLGCNENESFSIGRTTPAQNLSDGQVHTLRVRYVPGTLSVFVDNAATPAIQVAYSLVTGGTYLTNQPAAAPVLPNGTMYAGFSATTGASGLWETVEILSWSFASTPLVDPCYAGTFGSDVLSVAGSSGGPLRRVGIYTWQPFAIDLALPVGGGAPAPFVLLASLAATPGAPGAATPIGNACLPMLPLGPGVLVLADTFGVFGGLLPAAPAPTAIPLPAGTIRVPLALTLQGVMLAGGAGLGITNAVDVRFEPLPAPQVQSVTPLSAAPGTAIRVGGTGFGPGAVLEVNGAPTAVTSASSTEIVFAYPAGLPCGSQVTVRNLDGSSSSAALNPVPSVTGTTLGSGPAAGGATFVVQGTGFAPGTQVTIGGAAATVLTASATAVAIRTPPGAPGQATVVLTTPGGCSATTTYTYL